MSITVALLALAPTVKAQTGTGTVSFTVSAINIVAFTGAPSLTINAAAAGATPASATGAATWGVTTNQSGAKITARIPTNVPAGLTLSVSLTAPSGATSAGYQALSIVAVDVVTGVTKVTQAGLAVNYRLDATPAAGVIASTSRVITYTITGGT